ncbi:uncharacterized protein LOC123411162 [Hordeum vulgare subsp. vulgare]|uniref:F-box protein AT5G49610-like beta-propeller domain-containing protein n=1 Tax=Hordeum vulgare subsp. vulgare TaxID=112509 RepID=A0A8I6Z770_HORVV|nr:uncharacterized protein LOC123411162 [Hordeum vulgare subsp. vulgare]
MAAVSKVLEDEDLLTEILLRTVFPTTLLKTALVCTRWLTHASDRAFLRRFREIHPPRLLGFYINKGQNTPHFIPILPQPLELAGVIRRTTSSLGTYQRVPSVPTYILGCRNGNVLIRQHDRVGITFAAHNVVFPERGMDILPQFPRPQSQYLLDTTYSRILSKEEGDGLSYLYVLMHQTRDGKHRVYIYILRHGIWCMNHILTIQQPPRPWSVLKSVLSNNKIYVPAGWRNIIVLNLSASSFSIIELPEGMEYGERNTILSQADDVAGVYLIHVKKFQLRIWLHNGYTWLLMDTIYLRGICADLSMADGNTSLLINQAGDNAEFVFLDMGRCTFLLDIKCKTMHKVYEKEDGDNFFCEIHPLMMIWPPVFPTLKDDPTRNAM